MPRRGWRNPGLSQRLPAPSQPDRPGAGRHVQGGRALGNAKRITCMYHGWQFDTLGKCVEIPRMLQGYQDRLDKSDASLTFLPCAVGYGGFVWVNLDQLAAPLGDFIG